MEPLKNLARYLLVDLGEGASLAIAAEDVGEPRAAEVIVPLPASPPWVSGVALYNDAPLTVVDLGRLLCDAGAAPLRTLLPLSDSALGVAVAVRAVVSEAECGEPTLSEDERPPFSPVSGLDLLRGFIGRPPNRYWVMRTSRLRAYLGSYPPRR